MAQSVQGWSAAPPVQVCADSTMFTSASFPHDAEGVWPGLDLTRREHDGVGAHSRRSHNDLRHRDDHTHCVRQRPVQRPLTHRLRHTACVVARRFATDGERASSAKSGGHVFLVWVQLTTLPRCNPAQGPLAIAGSRQLGCILTWLWQCPQGNIERLGRSSSAWCVRPH